MKILKLEMELMEWFYMMTITRKPPSEMFILKILINIEIKFNKTKMFKTNFKLSKFIFKYQQVINNKSCCSTAIWPL